MHIRKQLLVCNTVLITPVYDFKNMHQARGGEQVFVCKSEQTFLTFAPCEQDIVKLRINLSIHHQIHIAFLPNGFDRGLLSQGRDDLLVHFCDFKNRAHQHTLDMVNNRLIFLKIGLQDVVQENPVKRIRIRQINK